MESKSYHQHCGLARTLDRVGERWTLLLMREFLLGPRRYGQLLHSCSGITTNLLAKRLRDLEGWGLIEKSGRGPGVRYQLTEAGQALEPALLELARWGMRWMSRSSPEDRYDLAWGLLTCKLRYRGGCAGLLVGLKSAERCFSLHFSDAQLVVREEVPVAQLWLEGQEWPLLRFLFLGSLAEVEVREHQEGSLALFCQALELPQGVP